MAKILDKKIAKNIKIKNYKKIVKKIKSQMNNYKDFNETGSGVIPEKLWRKMK